jgi:glucose/arabinose dehydrogenase
VRRTHAAAGAAGGLSDDELGRLAIRAAVAELTWFPDVAPAVIDRLGRDAVAYPEHFDRRSPLPGSGPGGPGTGAQPSRRRRSRLPFLGLLVGLGLAAFTGLAGPGPGVAAAGRPEDLRIALEPVAEGLDRPVFVTGSGDGSGDLYIVEQPGRIRVMSADGSIAPEPFLDIRDAVAGEGEQGLLGLAFHPGYAEDGRLYVDYTRREDGATVVSELTARDGVADPASERRLLLVSQPFANHNGGMVAFDAQGYLLVGMGDGGGGGDPVRAGQDPHQLLGKLLRLDVDGGDPYGIPPDNGFLSDPVVEPEIHAMGLRNPWRFSVDPATGDVLIGDVGQNAWEEVSLLPGGRGGQNFGWNVVEGPACYEGECDLAAYTPPVLVYSHDEGCSIVGGYVYRGANQPLLEGIYLFGDYCSGTIWGVAADDLHAGGAEAVAVGSLDGRLVSFGVDDAGELYVVDQGGGRVLRIGAEPAG